jgi:ribosomal protein L11 methyltransferase
MSEAIGGSPLHSLLLSCSPTEVDQLSAELWEAGTIGIEEIDSGDRAQMIAAFAAPQPDLLERFASYSPEWRLAPSTDWIAETHRAFAVRAIGERLFVAPAWSDDPTPPGRLRIIHNPGLACGTGEHPCTQLALLALENFVRRETRVIDIGAGSGILAIAALRLGAASAIAVDPDETALTVARENFSLNNLPAQLIAGSADSLADAAADLTVANINATVLLAILDDLLRITRPNGHLILTGFPEPELAPFAQFLDNAEVSASAEWRCITATLE